MGILFREKTRLLIGKLIFISLEDDEETREKIKIHRIYRYDTMISLSVIFASA